MKLQPIADEIHKMKYRLAGESFDKAMARIAGDLADNEEHFRALYGILKDRRFLPGGRIQAAAGAPRAVTYYNCFVSGTIEDSMEGIMRSATEAAFTMRMGGGIGYDFSTLRPKGELIKTLDSCSSGPVSFMQIFDAVCGTIASAGNRRGAQMGILRVDHPDIEEFVSAKTNEHSLRRFNISVAVTDEFMEAVRFGRDFDLRWGGKVYKTIKAKALWDTIMRNTWDWAEPGVVFIDRINEQNNLWYCETIAATNPCGEQPLPPYGACLLGSFNLTRYLRDGYFDYDQFSKDIPVVVRAMDNVVDRSLYPLEQQRKEALSKRRMGLGITGFANASEFLGYPYGSEDSLEFLYDVMETLRDQAYRASALLAKEKGPFPLLNKEKYLKGKFVRNLPEHILDLIEQYGIRNSHLLSIAPTGTISLSAGNVSSGIEPVFLHQYDRVIQTATGPVVETIYDYGVYHLGIKGKTTEELEPIDHLKVQRVAQKFVDSAISKTINIGPNVSWEQFKDVYMKAWEMGLKGVTTFRNNGKREGILKETEEEKEPEACYIDPTTGQKTCE